jgi:DNA invertase Pin-like site-specific DNA recombinase
MSKKLSTTHLERGAIVYVRMSTPLQVREHTESRRRQYELVERARALGFVSVAVIDDDLGRSGSGLQERPGFQKLVAAVCSGNVGAVFCLEASRLARNGRDWHHLLDLCALVGVVLADPEGTYDPRLMNDRLLLGLKGTMSEYELGLLRQRSLESRDAKASRGELRCGLPPGFLWSESGKMEKDPDIRIVGVLELVFTKFHEFATVRQTWLWFRDHDLSLPVLRRTESGVQIAWKMPAYHNVLSILCNPMYAGAYVFGRTGQRTSVVGGRARRTNGHRKPMEQWSVLIQDHHAGYISWEQFLRNQSMIADNAHMKKRTARKSGRGGRALLSGMMRCTRCGYMLRVFYGSKAASSHRYICRSRDLVAPDGNPCVGVGGVRVDRAVAVAMLEALTPKAIDAAAEAARHLARQSEDARTALAHELEEARYEARLAARRYEAVDPEKRLVAHELEARWETALQRCTEIERRLDVMASPQNERAVPDLDELRELAKHLPVIWNAPQTDMQLKQRIARILIKEVIVDVDETRREAVIVVHWTGGRHTELRVPRNRGPLQIVHRPKAIDVVRRMADSFSDREIAVTLNRASRGERDTSQAWTELRVRDLRKRLELPDYDPSKERPEMVSRDQAAAELGICVPSVGRLIARGVIPATQVVPYAPWRIPAECLRDDRILAEVRAIIERRPSTLAKFRENKNLTLPGIN